MVIDLELYKQLVASISLYIVTPIVRKGIPLAYDSKQHSPNWVVNKVNSRCKIGPFSNCKIICCNDIKHNRKGSPSSF